MRFLLLIIFIISPATFAQRSISREQFMVNVRPVLNGILNDFYQMVTMFPEFPKELVPLIQELDTITEDKEALRENCPRVLEAKCATTINSLRGKLQKIRALSMALLSQQKMGQQLYMSSLTGLRQVNDFDAELEEVKSILDNSSYLLKAQIKHKRETYSILKELDELNTLLSLAVVEFIPYAYKEDFRTFYFNFVHPIQLQISKNKNFEYVNRNVEALNFAINLLNMNLTKRKKTPEGMAPYLNTLHNRWNSILRYYF